MLLAAIVLPLALLPVAGSGVAHADPTSTADLNSQLDRLNQQADQLVEDYLEQSLALGRTRAKLAAVQRQAQAAQRSYDDLQARIAAQATNAYVNGPGSELAAVLTTGDPSSAVERMQSLELLAQQSTELVTSLKAARRSLDASRAVLRSVEAQQAAEVTRLRGKKTEVDRAVDRAERLLNQMRAANRARIAALNRRAAPSQKAVRTGGLQQSPTPPPVSGSVSAVIRWAYRQLGKPYQWGASGPDAFDCSGFTMAAWAQAGVGLPHSSRSQYGVTMRVSAGNLKPGDLIFRYSPISHVSMYVGGGKQISATHTGDVVRIQSASLPNIAGYGRPGG
ncbi:MAG TPA: NlpC/P60 family protein [Actinomycetes bacterium]|jgi:cell wall-associated NlpC family hydrolase|nr:NlpC/P60 family protein [Actinomycetes bacterium]